MTNHARDRNLLITSLGVVKAIEPDAVLCENVEGIGRQEDSVLGEFRTGLDGLDYSFYARIINAKNFGVPQSRRRTIGVGYHRKTLADFPDDVPGCLQGKRCPTVQEIIGRLPPLAAGEVAPNLPNHRARHLSDLNLKRIACAAPGQSNQYLKDTPWGDLTLACHQKLDKPSFGDTYTRMAGDQPAPTITTKFISITNGRFGHYDTRQNRGLSVQEGALLQTFPEQYAFYPENNLQFCATLIGNAVPPKIARFYGEYIRSITADVYPQTGGFGCPGE